MSEGEKKKLVERAERIPTVIKVECSNENRKLIDFVRNISVKGVFISCIRPFEKGDIIELKFQLPNMDSPIKVKGQVVWSRSEPEGKSKIRGMGIRFLNLTPWDEEAIKNFMKIAKTIQPH